MTFELIFSDVETGKVTYAITDVVTLRWITPSEIQLITLSGRLARCPFKQNEKLEIIRVEK